jgi:uncharacterized protein YqhQ
MLYFITCLLSDIKNLQNVQNDKYIIAVIIIFFKYTNEIFQGSMEHNLGNTTIKFQWSQMGYKAIKCYENHEVISQNKSTLCNQRCGTLISYRMKHCLSIERALYYV